MKRTFLSQHARLRTFTALTIIIMIISTVSPVSVRPAYALDAPIPIAPAEGTETTINNYAPVAIPTVSWQPVEGAITYRIQFDTDIGFTDPIAVQVVTANTQYTPIVSTPFIDGVWYWRVRVETPAPVSEYSPPMSFTKTWASYDNTPTLDSPNEGTTLDFFNAPAFSWSRTTGAARYLFEIAALPDGFSSPILSIYTLANSYQPSAKLANGTYYWHVLPIDAGNHLGTASEVRSFTLAYGTTVFGQTPTLLEPADNSYPVFTPTFRWTAVVGAARYRLEYTSDETCDFASGAIAVETRMTEYTPTTTFPNDASYCWRVRVVSGASTGDWSEIWHFQKRWYIQTHLLTPTNLFQHAIYPLYSWAPVPGAASYLIEIDTDPSFAPAFETGRTANPFYTPTSYIGTNYYYWRVTTYDWNNNPGETSEVFEFQSFYTSTAPSQVYPLYYYPPNDPVYYDTAFLNPYEDRSVAYPTFMWHRVSKPSPEGGPYTSAYRVEVDDSPYFNSIDWSANTENTSITPIADESFAPQVGTTYYWRVCPLTALDGNCTTYVNDQGITTEWWSQIWPTRFDTSLGLPPTSGTAPTLLRPMQGQEVVEATPLLEWYPFTGASEYRVQISRAADFSSIEMDETTSIPVLSPRLSLAQRSLGRTDYGTFYWRVCASSAGTCTSDWSTALRFQIASQSEWALSRTLGDPYNQLIIGDDPNDVTPENYELTTLYASQAIGTWYFGFNATLEATDMTYALYIDVDHKDGSGATAPPSERSIYNVTTIPAHQPEFAIFVDQIGGVVDATNTWVFAWDGVAWGTGQRLSQISNGALYYNALNYIELQLPYGAIGMDETTGSMAVMLFSVDSSGTVHDTVPSDPDVPGNAELSRFTSVSDHMNLLMLPNTYSGDPTTIPSVLPLFWDFGTGDSVGGEPTTPFAGSLLEIALDESYDPILATYSSVSSLPYLAYGHEAMLDDIDVRDNIYFWRVKPRYLVGAGSYYGAYTGGWSFRRVGFTPQNLQISVSFATPTFSWDMAEGAGIYTLQVSQDPNFGTTVINVQTPLTTYTPLSTLANDDYYWRVRIRRYGSTDGDWSAVQQFSLSLPSPTGLTPDNLNVQYAPTMCWDPILEYANGHAVLAAWMYKVEVSIDPEFGTIYDSKQTEQNCWTPTKGYNDGTYYWHVAMIDGNSRTGGYSATAQFTKQYPITTLIGPFGSTPGTPTIVWSMVDGASAYKLQVATNSTFSPLYDSTETVNTQYTPLKVYGQNQVYYWRVAIRDYEGRYGPYNDATLVVGNSFFTWLPLIARSP